MESTHSACVAFFFHKNLLWSAARSSRHSTQDPAEMEQLREELRRHQDYLKQQAAQHEYYATQIQQQQTLIQVSSKDNSFHFKICIDLKC
jgi:hypothetical protein